MLQALLSHHHFASVTLMVDFLTLMEDCCIFTLMVDLGQLDREKVNIPTLAEGWKVLLQYRLSLNKTQASQLLYKCEKPDAREGNICPNIPQKGQYRNFDVRKIEKLSARPGSNR